MTMGEKVKEDGPQQINVEFENSGRSGVLRGGRKRVVGGGTVPG